MDVHQRNQQETAGGSSKDEAEERRAQCSLTDRTLDVGGRAWTITAAAGPDPLLERVQTEADLAAFPYGLLLWPSALALAAHLAACPALVAGRRVLELGAGVGLPGLVAQSLGAAVTQTDFQPEPLALAQRNAHQNGISGVHTRQADWRNFPTLTPFPVVLGSDILYERSLHDALFSLFTTVLAPGGLLVLTDPLRPAAFDFADTMERRGWQVTMESRQVAWEGQPKEVALFTARR